MKGVVAFQCPHCHAPAGFGFDGPFPLVAPCSACGHSLWLTIVAVPLPYRNPDISIFVHSPLTTDADDDDNEHTAH
jgi:hypothetical protein